MFANHDSPLTRKLSRHLRVYVYGVDTRSPVNYQQEKGIPSVQSPTKTNPNSTDWTESQSSMCPC